MFKNGATLGQKCTKVSDQSHTSDREQHLSDKIEAVTNLYATLRNQITNLETKSLNDATRLKAIEEKIHSLTNEVDLLNKKSEKDLATIEYLAERLNTFEEKFKASNRKLTDLKVKHDNDLNSTFGERQAKYFNSKISLITSQVNDLNETLVKNYIKTNVQIYSLAINISIEGMKSQGYQILHDITYYAQPTTLAELNAVKSKCSSLTVLCAGGAAVGSDNLMRVSCGKCHSVIMPTAVNKPVLNNGAYWYLTNGFSFGFAPISAIKQSTSDTYDYDERSGKNCQDNKRLSWSLHDGWGGWRLGNLTNDGLLNGYRKILLLS